MPFAVKEIYDAVCEKYGQNKRLEHILGVARLAESLALKFGLDAEKAYTTLEEIIKDYNARENEAGIKTKFLMLMNGWRSPFIACTELVKFIERQGDRKLAKKANNLLKQVQCN